MNCKTLLAAGVAFVCIALPAAIVMVDNGPALFQVPPAGQPEVLAGKMDIPAGSAVAFDRKNRPFIVNAVEPEQYGFVATLEDGRWVKRDFTAVLKAAYPDFAMPTEKQINGRAVISFDRDDGLYVLVPTPQKNRDGSVNINGNMVLLFSPDFGKTFRLAPLQSRPYLTTMESSSGGRVPPSPPVILRGVHLKSTKDTGAFSPAEAKALEFSSLNRLEAIIPEKVNNRYVKFAPPLVLSERANGVTSHSGSNHIAARVGDRLFVAFIEVPERPLTQGNPTFVAAIDLKDGRLEDKTPVATAMPTVSDCHSAPTLTADSSGKLQLLTGSHGWDPAHIGFYFTQSADAGSSRVWTPPVALGNGQSYGDMVIDGQDNLHVVYRVHPQLWYQRFDRAANRWDKPVTLVEYAPARKANNECGYTVFHQHLFIDRNDNLYVKFIFNDFETGLKGKFPLMWLVSPDGGRTWRIPTTEWVAGQVKP